MRPSQRPSSRLRTMPSPDGLRFAIYDENGYCVKKEKCRIPDDIAAKLAEMNK